MVEVNGAFDLQVNPVSFTIVLLRSHRCRAGRNRDYTPGAKWRPALRSNYLVFVDKIRDSGHYIVDYVSRKPCFP